MTRHTSNILKVVGGSSLGEKRSVVHHTSAASYDDKSQIPSSRSDTLDARIDDCVKMALTRSSGSNVEGC